MNRIGRLFTVTTWGESHGPSVGALLEGCPAGLRLNQSLIEQYLEKNDRPIPAVATNRIEQNKLTFLAGCHDGITIGTPLVLQIENTNVRSSDYKPMSNIFRPGHADKAWYDKYGMFLPPGSGRASGRTMISLVAAGCIAGSLLKRSCPDLSIDWNIISMAGVDISGKESLRRSIDTVLTMNSNGESSGGELQFTIKGVPAGIGSPRTAGLNVLLTSALMGMGGVKSVYIGGGAACSSSSGSDWNGKYLDDGGYESKNGGICGGISDGGTIVLGCSVKPVPTRSGIMVCGRPDGRVVPVTGEGRHDLNCTPRLGPVGKALIQVILVDQLMEQGYILKDRIV
jgi:chorismate synthase